MILDDMWLLVFRHERERSITPSHSEAKVRSTQPVSPGVTPKIVGFVWYDVEMWDASISAGTPNECMVLGGAFTIWTGPR